MTGPEVFKIDSPVLVFDDQGEFICRGTVVGVTHTSPPLYDVKPLRAKSIREKIGGIPAHQVKRIGKPILAYDKKPAPRHFNEIV